MPAKNRIKDYKANTYYHIYNRGIDGRDIFCDEEDFERFKLLLRQYILGPEDIGGPFKSDRPSVVRRKSAMSMSGEMEVAAFCLMPNHFHLLVRQLSMDGITKYMRRMMTAYMMYFNRKYKRRGPLFEMVYRAVVVPGGEGLLHMTRFIHLNPVNRVVKRFGPVETVSGTKPEEYQHSSYTHYIGIINYKWIKIVPNIINASDYQKWVENPKVDSMRILGKLTIE